MQVPFIALAGWHDVFHEILNHLEPADSDYDYDDLDHAEIRFGARRIFRSALLSLALSCRALMDPSLDKLWHHLDSIHPLLRLLPNYQRRDYPYHLIGGISPEAWSRLQTYATRVRSSSFFREASIDTSVWLTILQQCQDTVLFPNLRNMDVLVWRATLDKLIPIHRFASPSLRHLCLSIDMHQDADTTTLSTLSGLMLQEFAAKAPGLVQLVFLPSPSLTIGREHLMCLSRFTKMERLDISDSVLLDEAILLTFTSFKNLTHLQASILLQDESAPLHFEKGFRKLTMLDIRSQPAHLARFMLASSMSRLNDLRLRLNFHIADGFRTSFPSICQHIGPHQLTRLQVALGDFVRPPQLLMDLLESILSFVNLEKLEFFFEKHLPLRNEDLEHFARAWPKLRTLVLIQSEDTMSEPDRTPGSVARPTLHGLVALARGCPRLAQICIPDLDATSVPQADSVPLTAHGPLNLCIQNLVGAVERERQLDVAVVLDRLFPRLRLGSHGIEDLLGYEDNPNPHLEDSKNISLLLRAMQIARQHYPGGEPRGDALPGANLPPVLFLRSPTSNPEPTWQPSHCSLFVHASGDSIQPWRPDEWRRIIATMPPSFPTLAGWEDAFHEILSHLRPSEYFVFDDNEEIAARFSLRRTLLSLAVSCHAFLDPSLDMLWYSLDNVHPLLKLLPNYRRRDSTYYLTGEIAPKAWSRLKMYAARVRSITHSRKAGIDPSVWQTVFQQCQNAPLFPNLRKLDTIKLNATHIFALRVFVSPSLREAFLEFYEDTGSDQNTDGAAPIAGLVLDEFSTKAPELLKLCFYPDMRVDRERLACISRFTQIEELYLGDHSVFDEDLLPMLTRLKSLAHLKINIQLRDPPESAQLVLTDEFHKLTGLDLCGPPAHLARFIVASSMPQLDNLSIWFGSHHPDGLDSSLASICRHIGPLTLTRFKVQLGSFIRPPRYMMRIIEPLLPLANLEEVVFTLADYIPLRDEDLARISRAWPKLRVLRLQQSSTALEDPDREPGSIERPTLEGLIELARRCPRLTELCIPELNASNPPQFDDVPLMGHGSLALCIQNLVGAEEDETQFDVAVVLDRLFPRLDLEYNIDELPQYGDNINPYTEEADNISKLLRTMQLGRSHYPRGIERLGRPESS